MQLKVFTTKQIKNTMFFYTFIFFKVFSQTEIILQPIVLACRTGNARVIAIAINCLQKLVIFRAFPRECIGRIFGVLETAAEMNSDIQLKSLQCLSPLMANYNDIYGSELIRVMPCQFMLYCYKLLIYYHTSSHIF